MTMKAAYIQQPGPPDSIRYADLSTPEPAGSQVLVQVKAVSVNPIDTYIRGGMVQMELPSPYIVGSDLAGVVTQVGADAKRFKAGDRVWGTNQGFFGRQGTFCEYAAVDEDWLYPTPDAVSDDDAAAMALVGMTAHLGLFGPANLTGDDVLFVNGGSGGVGSAVVQMAKAVGATVITTGGSDEKVDACRKLGADIAINYRTQDVDEQIKEAAAGGINLWWETLREPDFERVVPMLAPRGRMIVMAGRDARPPLPVGQFYIKCCSLFGFAMLAYTPDEQRAAAERINQWMADGRLKARIDRVIPLSQTAAAHQLQEENTIGGAGTLAGKIVLTP